ncbi:thiamine phosphate synthase [Paenibacillus sp. JX-17]|uniref:Thiamine phosphate synthase n=1 Tax=Paenibacillus lacisoli TaxID=3064525 RepID=A0ABT9C7P0_9BACL|nr:thiamine phosphate synthase [Paenibacillus sp. JX-17]MDO7904915.1 thiamine phosphate synthase [Paenibacillus sp. JX-17]
MTELAARDINGNKPELHCITSSLRNRHESVSRIQQIEPYIDWIHLRDKQQPTMELCALIQQLQNEGVNPRRLVINDRVDAALVNRLSAVQLPSLGLPVKEVRQYAPHLRIGASVHSLDEAAAACSAGASYVLYGHIFATFSKAGAEPRGLQALADICSSVSLPVIAIGGITPERVLEVLQAGATGIAVLSGIWDAADPGEAARRYRQSLDEASISLSRTCLTSQLQRR